MSAFHLILSPIAPAEMAAIDGELEQRLVAYLDDHPDVEAEIGEVGAGGIFPTRKEVEAAYEMYRLPLPPDLLDRLATCRSAFMIDRVRDGGLEGGLEVSALRFVVERAGAGLALLVDYPFVTCEDLLERLKDLPRIPGFDAKEPPARRRPTVKRRAEKPGELRAIKIVAALRAAQEDPEVAHDVMAVLRRADTVVAGYAALLFEHGAMSDVDAARRLGVEPDTLTAAADRLAALLAGTA